MSQKVQTSFNEQSSGFWITSENDDNKTDVHITANANRIVVGHNAEHMFKAKSGQTFTDLALTMNSDGKIVLQYVGADNNAAWTDVSAKVASDAILKMLNNIKERLGV